ncbi:hypothetical protein M5K25_004211 [Dendrobium thyrsiflorum]|uniref:Uncharacterized protein n=1 Tax=Dendrobium thyrsiflorum TaxID=117978 RepID=A0ABD0VLB9_DENTH
MKPRSGLAHPSLNTCTHCKSIRDSLIRGKPPASVASFRIASRSGPAGATNSTSFPPSGSIRPHRTLAAPPYTRRRRTMAPPGKPVRRVLGNCRFRPGIFAKSASMEAIAEMAAGVRSRSSDLKDKKRGTLESRTFPLQTYRRRSVMLNHEIGIKDKGVERNELGSSNLIPSRLLRMKMAAVKVTRNHPRVIESPDIPSCKEGMGHEVLVDGFGHFLEPFPLGFDSLWKEFCLSEWTAEKQSQLEGAEIMKVGLIYVN